MKSILKYTVIILLAGFALAACSKDDNEEPKASLNGVWQRFNGSTLDIEVTIDGNSGKFTTINSGDWKTAMEQDFIKLGDVKFKNIVATSDTTWSCENLWWESSWGTISSVRFEPATLTLGKDGVLTSVSLNNRQNYNRKK